MTPSFLKLLLAAASCNSRHSRQFGVTEDWIILRPSLEICGHRSHTMFGSCFFWIYPVPNEEALIVFTYRASLSICIFHLTVGGKKDSSYSLIVVSSVGVFIND